MVTRGLVRKGTDDNDDDVDTSINISEMLTGRQTIVKLYQKTLHCSTEQANQLYESAKTRVNVLTVNQISDQIQMLLDAGIDREVMLQFPFIFTMEPDELQKKLKLLQDMNLRDINDFVPLLELQSSKLGIITRNLKAESGIIPGENRIYYFANKLKIAPIIATQLFLKYQFLFSLPMRLITRNLDVLIKHKVLTTNILRDPWVFAYSSRKTDSRFDKAKEAERPKMMPWMARVPADRFEKSLRTTIEQRKALGDCETINEYLMERLKLSEAVFKTFVNRYPPAMKVRPTKIKSILDYLLDEEQFSTEHVVKTPRILCYSLKLIQERVETLKKLGHQPSNLLTLTLSEAKFDAYVEQIKRQRMRSKRVKTSFKK